MLNAFLEQYELYAERLPLEIFVLLGAFVEEVIAPIPSPFVMTLAGSVTAAQGHPFWYLFVVAVIAAAGKTLGGMVLYVIADKTEDIVFLKLSRYVGITHEEVEKLGNRLSRGSWRDWAVLMGIRSTPVIASAPISVICGFLKIRWRMFVITTFLGSIIRDFVYLYVGFTTLGTANSLTEGLGGIESFVQISTAISGLAFLGWIIYKRKMKKKTAASK